MPTSPQIQMPPSQLQALRDKQLIRVEYLGDKAYWIKDNVFYQADHANGSIDLGTAEAVDTDAISEDDYEALFKVIDKLG